MNTEKMSKKELAEAIQITHPLLNKQDCIDYANEIKLFTVNDYSKRVLEAYLYLEKMQMWKLELIRVCDNSNYIEERMADITTLLSVDHPDTDRIRNMAYKISEWANEIDLAKERAEEKEINPTVCGGCGKKISVSDAGMCKECQNKGEVEAERKAGVRA